MHDGDTLLTTVSADGVRIAYARIGRGRPLVIVGGVLEIRIPTLLLLGGASPPSMRTGSKAIADALPSATTVEMPGQEHIAMQTAPEVVADAVGAFLAQDH